MIKSVQLSRRALVAGLGGLVIAGCGRAQQSAQPQGNAAVPAQPAARLAAMKVYRDPGCGCCVAWAEIARQAGYQVSVIDRSDLPAVKAQFGVPDALHSCHTTEVGGYAVEGHVPLADVARLLERRPAGIRGIAVPGMPRGSPGMEMPDGSSDRFQVMAFDAAGRISVFTA